MIWRDDDIGFRGDLEDLRTADDAFQASGLAVHTVAVVASGLERQPGLVDFIRARKMDVQLHCWQHDDLTVSAKARDELAPACGLLERLFGCRPTVLYPPWNRSNAAVETAAAALGLRVSAQKTTLEAYIRAGGDVDADVVNFHYWHEPERAILAAALAVHLQQRTSMKTTDYALRAAPFDTYLRGRRHLIGVEVGVDAGAHAEALLRYYDIDRLYLVDRWSREYPLGFCEGRLAALGLWSRFERVAKGSLQAASLFTNGELDFVYIDQEHDGAIVTADLDTWWPKLKATGVLGYRNYSGTPTPLKAAIDVFVAKHTSELETHIEPGEIVLVKR